MAELPKLALRPRRRKSLWILILTLIIFALFAYLLGWSKFLVVREITFSGTPQSNLVAHQVTAIYPELRTGRQLGRLNLPGITKAISTVPWIAKSSISRNWFSGKISITLFPRIPVAEISGADGGLKYLDATGFEFSEPLAPTGLAQITLGRSDLASRLAAGKFISLLPADILASMQSLTLISPKQISMSSNLSGRNLTINWGDVDKASELMGKVRIFRALIALPENAKIESIDLSNLNSPIVK